MADQSFIIYDSNGQPLAPISEGRSGSRVLTFGASILYPYTELTGISELVRAWSGNQITIIYQNSNTDTVRMSLDYLKARYGSSGQYVVTTSNFYSTGNNGFTNNPIVGGNNNTGTFVCGWSTTSTAFYDMEFVIRFTSTSDPNKYTYIHEIITSD